jgi:hypothetical protein
MHMLTARPPASRPMEHRWGERVTLDCPVRLVCADESGIEGRVRNASISGAWIEIGSKLPMYTTLTAIIPAGAGARGRNIELPACVVRSGPGGIAVEWRDMGVPTLVGLLQEAGGGKALRSREHVFG